MKNGEATTKGEQLPEAVEHYVETVGSRLDDLLSDQLVGVYLHGSAVLGGFNPDRSDVDVLVVVDSGLEHQERSAIGEALSETALPCPAVGLELSVVQRAAAERPVAEPPYELHLSTQENKVIDGTGQTDPDLVLHFAVCREHGRLLGTGQPPQAVFSKVPRPMVLRQLRAELEWARNAANASVSYRVLNACRAWYFVEHDKLTSKLDGGQWAKAQTKDPVVIEQALARQQGRGPASRDADRDAAHKLADGVMSKIDEALAE